ncbi:MAG: Cof-type HAD-IIB family hydrolase [Dorea sp.]
MKHKIKMVGFDLDGTLLTSEKKMTERTKEALIKAAEQGVEILPVTGRPISGLPKEIKEFPQIRYAVTSNGARIVELKSDKTLYEKTLGKEKARKILDILGEYDTLREIYYGGIGYADESKMQTIERYVPHPAMAHYICTTRKPVADVIKKFESEKGDLDKVQGLFANAEERFEAWRKIEEQVDAEVTGALNNNVEVMEKGINKGSAILFMAEKLGIQIEEVMAFGDGANDIAMVKTAGIGVAVSNGIQEIREVADLVTESNDEDGVAKIIENYVLE